MTGIKKNLLCGCGTACIESALRDAGYDIDECQIVDGVNDLSILPKNGVVWTPKSVELILDKLAVLETGSLVIDGEASIPDNASDLEPGLLFLSGRPGDSNARHIVRHVRKVGQSICEVMDPDSGKFTNYDLKEWSQVVYVRFKLKPHK